MYIPDIYQFEDRQEINDFINRNGFGILINLTQGKLWATHIPLKLETKKDSSVVLHGHVSKENPQAESFDKNDQVLVVFSGPHAYVSSSWYDHENVPTWNFIAVHVYGTVKVLDENEVIASLEKLVDKYEADSENPVRVNDLSTKTMLQVRGIVGFEIEISEIHAKKKLSQNRNVKNYNAVVSKLENSDNPAARQVANEMKKNQLK